MGLNVIARANAQVVRVSICKKHPRDRKNENRASNTRRKMGWGWHERERGREREGGGEKGRIMSQWLSPRYGAVSLLL
jgi:hypothetical protein